jgi:formylglycine-generating enzyme required for sulfatase activity
MTNEGHDAINAAVLSLEGEFYNACTQGGKTAYPYGDSYEAGRCIDPTWAAEHPADTLVVTDTAARDCHGTEPPFDAIHDLSGSIEEWQNFCQVFGTSTISALVIGGSFSASPGELRCDIYGGVSIRTINPYVGFRCCADAVLEP